MKNKRNAKIGIIGHFGGNENILDGQTIKTKILYEELRRNTKWEIIKVDTYYKNKNPFKLLIKSLKCVLSSKKIIILLSGNGMKFYFPFLYMCSKIFHIEVFHDVIGGNLDQYVQKMPRYQKYLSTFKINWVETEGLKNKLADVGVHNCKVIPNFKRLNIAKIDKKEYSEPFKFCIFSRVMREKGIEIAISSIEKINREAGRKVCELDIYGRIDEGYKDRFNNIIKDVSNAIEYKGVVEYDKSVDVISAYYALLFPTFWDGEGFPGTIVDALSAGLPVIATDWNCNSEIIENMKNGIIYPNSNIKDLEQAIKYIINNKDKINDMKKNCVLSAKKYMPDEYVKQIINEVGE